MRIIHFLQHNCLILVTTQCSSKNETNFHRHRF